MKTANETQNIDVTGLVDAGLIDLDAVFSNADWDTDGDCVATYIACCYGSDGNSPGTLEIEIEAATEYGITAYRWRERDDAGAYESGEITLDRDAAIAAGVEYANENDATPDADNQIEAILESGWFSDGVTESDVRDIIDYIHSHDDLGQGHVIIGRGGNREWVTSGYVESAAIYLDIVHGGHGSWAACASHLLSAIADFGADQD